MDYEKKYKDALEKAKELAFDLPNGRSDRLYHVSDLEDIFPELKDNEGRIVACIGMCLTDADEQRFKDYNTTLQECIVWLEKQGEKSVVWSEEDEKMYQSILDDTVQKHFLTGDQFAWLNSLKDRVQPQPKQEWSEEDEKMLNEIQESLRINNGTNKMIKYECWFDDIKDKIQPKPKQEWSEEDRKHIDNIISLLNQAKERYVRESGQFPSWITEILWLKSFRKPSEEQMKMESSNFECC